MTPENTQEYLRMILDMETNLYIQNNTINKLYRQLNSLGNKEKISVPVPEEPFIDSGGHRAAAGIIIGMIVALIYLLNAVVFNSESSSSAIGEAVNVFISFIWAFVIGAIVGIIGGLIVGAIIDGITKSKKENECNREYQIQLKEYNRKVELDNQRVQKELVQKRFIREQIEMLEEQYKKTSDNLNKLYDYNIIHSEYQHNIVAISSFYQYFCKGITYSLSFDRETGDDGAYKIFENEIRLGIIISKLDDVISKLKDISANQQALYDSITNANKKIQNLTSSVNNMSTRLSSAIDRQTAITEYNAERINTELRFLNTMNAIYTWH